MIAGLRAFWRNLRHRARVDRDLDDELGAMLDLLVSEKIEAGMRPEEARRAAAIELGNLGSIKDHVRDVRAGAAWEALVQDVRHGVRLLLRNPLVTMAATASLAICIGANTAVFSLVNRLLFRDPPGVFDPARLVDIAPIADGRFREPFLHPMLLAELRRRVTLLEVYGHQLDAHPLSLRGAGGAERVFGAYVTMNYFEALGVRAALGRLFERGDSEAPGASPIAVLRHGFWLRRFDGDPALVGRSVVINGQPLTVVGVAAEEFRGISLVLPDLWLPSSMISTLTVGGGARLAAGGRLRSGASIAQATAEMESIVSGAMRDLPVAPVPGPGRRDIAHMSVRAAPASPLPPVVRGLLTGFLALLMGLAFLVLLIACVNVAGLLFVRGAARRREIAVRLAIGAGRMRLIRQLMTETLLLFLLGGTAGLVLARLLTDLLTVSLPTLPVFVDTSLPLDHRVLFFTGAVSFGAAIVAGLLPAMQSSRSDIVSALKWDAQGPSDRLRLRHGFVVAQVALSTALVIAAGLFAGAMYRSGTVETGFDARGVETTGLDLTLAGYTDATGPAFVRELLERVRAHPRVANATVAGLSPVEAPIRFCCGIVVPGLQPPDGEEFFQPAWNVVSPGFFTTLGIPLRGRDFGPHDRQGSDPVAIISEAAARQFWPGGDAVGKQMLWQQTPGRNSRMLGRTLLDRDGIVQRDPIRLTVVGVAGDVQAGARQAAATVYLPFQQKYQSQMSLLTRSRDGGRAAGEVRALVASMDPNLPVVSSEALNDRAGPVELQLRLAAGVSVAVGIVSVLLAAIGLYGVTAYAVTRRTREIGIRLAMGAQTTDVVRLVLGHGMVLVLVGSASGLALAAATGRVLAHNRFGIPAIEPLTFVGAAIVFVLVGLIACYVPVRRATRVNAVEALRYE